MLWRSAAPQGGYTKDSPCIHRRIEHMTDTRQCLILSLCSAVQTCWIFFLSQLGLRAQVLRGEDADYILTLLPLMPSPAIGAKIVDMVGGGPWYIPKYF